MSIKAIIQANLGQRLFPLDPVFKSDESVRAMIVSQEVLDAVEGDFPDNWDGLRLADFRETLDAFSTGEEITVGENPFQKPGDCYMARVDPVALEVVDIRTMFGPGIRVFGSIVDLDCFVALTWDYREDMNFGYECARCKHDWKQIFGSLEPYSKGKRLDECLTKVFAV